MRLPDLNQVSARLAAGLFAFAAGLSCFLLWQSDRARPGPKATAQTAVAQSPQPVAAVEPAPAATPEGVRGPIGKIDFKNFTYPSPSAGKRVTVRDGELEYPTEPGCGQTFDVQEVHYIDFDGDGEDEALVRFLDLASCGSSYASVNYFVYAVRKGRPRLLWSFATGSEASGGLKSFQVEGNELVLELYGTWSASGSDIVLEEEKGLLVHCDRCTNHYSLYRVAWDGQRFRRKSLEVIECPGGCDVK